MIARHKAAIKRAVDVLERDPPHRHVDIGSVTVACALGYLDLRFADDRWRDGHPSLTAWHEAFAQNKGLVETAPP
jgi:glutathione S-transferase